MSSNDNSWMISEKDSVYSKLNGDYTTYYSYTFIIVFELVDTDSDMQHLKWAAGDWYGGKEHEYSTHCIRTLEC